MLNVEIMLFIRNFRQSHLLCLNWFQLGHKIVNFLNLSTLSKKLQNIFRCNVCDSTSISFIVISFHQILLTEWWNAYNECMYYLFMKQVQGKLKSNCFHVGFLQSGGNVHVHVQESLHGTSLFGLFNLQLRQKIDKPFKRSLITIDPEKVDLN